MQEESDYKALLDMIFEGDYLWKYRNFQTVFNPYSRDWNKTNYHEKIEMIQKLLDAGKDFGEFLEEYKNRRYENRVNAEYTLEVALRKLLVYSLIN